VKRSGGKRCSKRPRGSGNRTGTDDDQCTYCKKPLVTRTKLYIGKDRKGRRHEVGECCDDKLKWVDGIGMYLNAEDAVGFTMPDEVKAN
jgi:hypothetical protein